jgi:proteasome lid subunit RPN8/RPN11
MSNFEIICPDEQMAKIEEHCFSETKVEVGGFLIGKIGENATTVTQAVAAKHTVGQSTQLTFTHDSWNEIYAHMENLPSDEVLIGWYHSHPNFGVFLSEHDQFIQNNFFKNRGQITIVVDPVRGRRGWFTSVNGKIQAHGKEVDTMKKRLGVSATNADANMDVVLGTKAPSASNLKIIAISALMATISFVAGMLVNNVSKSNDSTNLAALTDKVNRIESYLSSIPLSTGGNQMVVVTPTPTPKPRKSSKTSTKPKNNVKPSAKATSSSAKSSTRKSTTVTPVVGAACTPLDKKPPLHCDAKTHKWVLDAGATPLSQKTPTPLPSNSVSKAPGATTSTPPSTAPSAPATQPSASPTA